MSLKRVEIGVILVIGIVLLGLGISYSLGWLVGCLMLVIIKWNRNRFYNQIMDMKSFNIIQFVSYTASLLILMGGSFLLAFGFKDFINPYSLFAAFFAERIFMFFTQSMHKGGKVNVSK